MEKRGRIVLKFISFLLHRITLIVIAIAVTLVMMLGGRFELASAAHPNDELEIQKLTVFSRWDLTQLVETTCKRERTFFGIVLLQMHR